MLQTWQNIEETGLYKLRFVYRDEELKLGELLACMEENERSNLAGEQSMRNGDERQDLGRHPWITVANDTLLDQRRFV